MIKSGHILHGLMINKTEVLIDLLWGVREGEKPWMKPWFWPRRIKNELPLTEMESIVGGVALRRKMKMSVLDILSLRCL